MVSILLRYKRSEQEDRSMDQICSLFRDRENVGKSLGTGKFAVNL